MCVREKRAGAAACEAQEPSGAARTASKRAGSEFTCFAATKVIALLVQTYVCGAEVPAGAAPAASETAGPQFTCFPSTKSGNTDTSGTRV